MSESSGSGKTKKGFWKLAVFLVAAVLLGIGDFFLLIRLSNRTIEKMIAERVAAYEVVYSNQTTQQMHSETDIEILEKKPVSGRSISVRSLLRRIRCCVAR